MKVLKKSFTLIEMMISIALFTVVLLFLYQAFDMTKKSNDFYSSKLDILKNDNEFKKLLTSDFLNSASKSITFQSDKNDNTILTLQSNNTFHNNFYLNISYVLSRDNELLRLESKDKFDKNNIFKVLDNAYIDILKTDVDKFKVIKIENKGETFLESYILYIEYINGNDMYISLKSLK